MKYYSHKIVYQKLKLIRKLKFGELYQDKQRAYPLYYIKVGDGYYPFDGGKPSGEYERLAYEIVQDKLDDLC